MRHIGTCAKFNRLQSDGKRVKHARRCSKCREYLQMEAARRRQQLAARPEEAAYTEIEKELDQDVDR